MHSFFYTADYASRLVDDVSLFRELANSNRNVAQRVLDGVREFLKKISTVFSKNAADKAAFEKYGTDVEGLKKVVAQWESMLATTEEAVAGGNEGYVYTVVLKDNKTIKAASAADSPKAAVKVAETTLISDESIPHPTSKSKPQRSVKGQDLLSRGYSRTDAEYMDAVESGDTTPAQRCGT